MRMLGPAGAHLVVVGVDGSPESIEAARYAADSTARRGLELLVVHAWGTGWACGQRAVVADGVDGRSTGQALVDEVLSHVPVAPTTVVRTVVEPGPAGAILTALAEEAALVVLGQHHFDLVDGNLGGPVSSSVAEDARCPVVVVPAGWNRTVTGSAHLGLRPVVVALDEETPATSVLQVAYDEAERCQASLLVLHASTAAGGRSTSARTTGEILAGQQQDHPDVATDYRFVLGETVPALVDASSRAGLLVLGRPHLRLGRRSWEHSVAHAMLHRARCPLAVVPPVPAPARPIPTSTRVPVS